MGFLIVMRFLTASRGLGLRWGIKKTQVPSSTWVFSWTETLSVLGVHLDELHLKHQRGVRWNLASWLGRAPYARSWGMKKVVLPPSFMY